MKKILLLAAIFTVSILSVNAQSTYKTAVGLGLDFGSGFTFVGPSAKYFLVDNSAVQAELMFESGVTALTGMYQYHGYIDSVEGLNWFAGGGFSVLFGSGESGLALRPDVGLDYKIDTVPLVLSFDWRPFIGLNNLYSKVGTFGLGVRYVIN